MSEIYAPPKLITPFRHSDHRGFFAETFSRKKYEELGIDFEFVQDNHSLSHAAGTIRGLHFQIPPFAQAKLVRCGQGSIFDVAVDIRVESPTFGKWKGYKLTAENGHQFYVPIGFAHGFITLEPNSEIIYKCSNYYNQKCERSVLWSDPNIGIKWELEGQPTLNEKDRIAPLLEDFESPFIFGVNS